MLLYHYCRSLSSVIFGEVKPDPKYADDDYKDVYSWLEKEVGFYPLFLAVGDSEEDIRMTGYSDNWRIKTASWFKNGKPKGEYRKKGEFPNYVLFSFENVEGIFMDYDYWHLVLNAGYKNYQMTNYEKKLIFKPSWIKSKWLRKTKKDSHSVQLVAPKLVLANADRIWVRNKKTKNYLKSLGFDNISLKRILVDRPI